MIGSKGKKEKTVAAAMSLVDYARHRGVSPKSVTVAVQRGRLRESLGRRTSGRRYIVDVDLADREWTANTQSSDRTLSELAAAGVPPMAVSRARRAAADARRAELDVAEREGQIVAVDEIRAEVIAEYSLVKTRLLALPSLVAQRLPHLAGEIVPVVDELLREILEELAADEGEGAR